MYHTRSLHSARKALNQIPSLAQLLGTIAVPSKSTWFVRLDRIEAPRKGEWTFRNDERWNMARAHMVLANPRNTSHNEAEGCSGDYHMETPEPLGTLAGIAYRSRNPVNLFTVFDENKHIIAQVAAAHVANRQTWDRNPTTVPGTGIHTSSQ